MGFEIDGEDAFQNQIDSFTEAFIDILKDEIAFLKDHLKEVGEVIEKLAEHGLAGAIAAAIAVAVVLAIDVFVALWAPADLIIEDAIGPTTLDLVELTSVNFPLPLPSEHVTPKPLLAKRFETTKTRSGPKGRVLHMSAPGHITSVLAAPRPRS
jgi:hypothetical protein